METMRKMTCLARFSVVWWQNSDQEKRAEVFDFTCGFIVWIVLATAAWNDNSPQGHMMLWILMFPAIIVAMAIICLAAESIRDKICGPIVRGPDWD
jgi:hypothetical protein